MESQSGFELLHEEYIPERNMLAKQFRHVKSGGRLLSMEVDDANKVFGISFRTPPSDSTGVAHILEHAVLGGSRKYPLKEPFVELIKGSMKTFLNAITFADKTVYPVASPNEKDFYNLVDVYLDAVLHPLITPRHLQQEGWHYELNSMDESLRYKGVVFNEMKGAYSSADGIFARYSRRSLFPDTTYGVDSGGDPREIPNLTYEQFKGFHERYYHPSNAYIYFYGDDALQKRLTILDRYLCEYSEASIESSIKPQARWSEPKSFTYFYSVDSAGAEHHNGVKSTIVAEDTVKEEKQIRPDNSNEETPSNKSMVRLNWMLDAIDSAEEVMLLSLLSYCLLGTSAAPLRKRLTDSGLGEDVIGGGLATGLLQLTFGVGLKGVALSDIAEAEKVIWESLRVIADQGIEEDIISAALNTIEFRLRENNSGSYPRGLIIMFSALNSWLYDKDPLRFLRYEEVFTKVRNRLSSEKRLFPDMINHYLLENQHRSTTVIKPQARLDEQRQQEEDERLNTVRTEMSQDELHKIIQNTAYLRQVQETPDTPEKLAKLPRLELEDLDRDEVPIPIEVTSSQQALLIYHEDFTSGIVYLDVGFDMRQLSADLLPYMSIFGRVLTEMGTSTHDYVSLLNRIGQSTGGVGSTRLIAPKAGGDKESVEDSAAWFMIRAKSTLEKSSEMLAIVRDILLDVQLDSRQRLRQIVRKAKAQVEASLIPGGSSVVATRLNGQFHYAGWLTEQISGVSNLMFLRRLVDQIDNDWPSVLHDLEQIRETLVNRQAMVCHCTTDQASWQSFLPRVEEFIDSLPSFVPTVLDRSPTLQPRNEGLTMPSRVNYVGKAANLYDLGYQMHGSVLPILNYLRTAWLWSRIRVQGGAYGAFSRFSSRSGVLSLLSYRDPNLGDTLDTYDGCASFLRSVELSQEELIRSVIGALSTFDSYKLPDAKGFTAMSRYLLGETLAERQRIRTELLETSQQDFRRFGETLEGIKSQGQVVILGSFDSVTAANRQAQEDWLHVIKIK